MKSTTTINISGKSIDEIVALVRESVICKMVEMEERSVETMMIDGFDEFVARKIHEDRRPVVVASIEEHMAELRARLCRGGETLQ